jgi:hypothetical protein
MGKDPLHLLERDQARECPAEASLFLLLPGMTHTDPLVIPGTNPPRRVPGLSNACTIPSQKRPAEQDM